MSTIDPGQLQRAMTRHDQGGRVWREWHSRGREPGMATFQVVIPIVGATSGPAFDAAWLGVALSQHPNTRMQYSGTTSVAQACTARGGINPAQMRRLQRVIAAARKRDREVVLREMTALARAFVPDGNRPLHGLRWVADTARVLTGNPHHLSKVTARWSWELQHPWSGRPMARPTQDLETELAENHDEDAAEDPAGLEAVLRGF